MEKKAFAVKPKRVETPFIYNYPVRGTDFCNCEEIIKKLQHETVTRKSQGKVWLAGERQVGKMSLLRYIQSKYENYDNKIKLFPRE